MAREEIARRPLHATLVLRTCEESDLAALEWFGMYTPHRSILRDAWRRHCAGKNLCYVVDFAGFPIAQAWVDLERTRGPNTAMLWAVRVFPIFQGQGIGRFMVREIERHIQARGVTGLWLGVEKHNTRARTFYERLGYRAAGELCERQRYQLPSGDWSEQTFDQYVMHKALTEARPCGAAPRRDGAASAPARELPRDGPPA